MPRVGKAPTERDLNDVFEIELNFIGCQRVGEPIERLLQLGFEIFENGYDFFNSRLVDHTVRSIDEQMDIFVKFEVRRKLHCCLIADPFRPFDRYGSVACERFSREPFQRNTEPFRGVFPLLKYSHIDRRVLGDYGMQLAIMEIVESVARIADFTGGRSE